MVSTERRSSKPNNTMIYYTGDIHGDPRRIVQFAEHWDLTENDIIVILGDVGANYYLGKRDNLTKSALAELKPTIFCIHGNHECRPEHIPTYVLKDWKGGHVWYEEAYPNILFARDGDIFTMEGIRHMVIGGAYSVDKYYRQQRGYAWWADEQPDDVIKARVEKNLAENTIDFVLSHTCPFRYEPREMFLSMIDQNSVDASTEKWFDEIETKVEYKAWLCGHWHTDKKIDKMHFLFNAFDSSEQILSKYKREKGQMS